MKNLLVSTILLAQNVLIRVADDVMLIIHSLTVEPQRFELSIRMPVAKTDDKVVLKHAKVCIGALSSLAQD